jgi:uncharacterized membrane protein YccC
MEKIAMKPATQTKGKESTFSPRAREMIRSWFAALQHSWRAAIQIDRSQLTAIPAIRTTIGFALPLAIGVTTGHVLEGVSVAGGATSLGAVGLTYTYRARTRAMLLACVGVALSAFVGSITSRIDWLSILVAGIWGIGAGMLVALGQSALVIGLQSAIALIILSHFMLAPAQAAIQAALMFAGALFQTALALIPIPWRQTAPERAALAAVYRQLADYAAHPANEQSGTQVRAALLKAQSVVSASNTQSRQGMIFFGLFEAAERIRLNVLVLRRLRQDLQGDEAEPVSSVTYLDQLLWAAAEQLREIANELRLTSQLARHTKSHQQIKQSLSALRKQDTMSTQGETIRLLLVYGEALRDHLHTAMTLAKSWKYRQQPLSIRIEVPKPSRLRLHDAWAILRANLTFRSAVFRHAIRLGVALAVATALYRLLPLPRGYWIALTALLVLRPDFTTTFTRGTARLAGTMLGAVLTTLLVSTLAPTRDLLVIFDAAMAYLAFALLFVNYALFSAFITMDVVLLLTFVIPQPLVTAAYRAIDTAEGGALALLIYLLWPTWERPQVSANLVDRLEALCRYLVAVLKAYADPSAYDELTLHSRRMAVRLARSNAEASVTRSLHEPAPHRIDPDLAQGLLAAEDGIAQSILTLNAYLVDNPARRALPEAVVFAAKVEEALGLLVTALREGQPVSTLPDLQEALRTLKQAGKSGRDKHHAAKTDLRFVLAEAKRVVRNIDTLCQLLAAKKEAIR